MKVILLEDNPINSEFVQTLLRMEGHDIIPYSEGDALLAALHTNDETFPYDVALIDLMLPGTLSGQDVMHRLQQQYPTRHLPFVVLSAASPQELDRVRADFPQTPMLRKPFKRQQLLDAIEVAASRA